MTDPALPRDSWMSSRCSMTPALFTDENLLSSSVCRMVNLSLEHGNSDGSCFAYVDGSAWSSDRISAITRPGSASASSAMIWWRSADWSASGPCLSCASATSSLPWTRHVRTGRDLLRRAFDAAQQDRRPHVCGL